MKLHRLELTGFGPFRETQTVDFDAFDADGIFLISGRTGAGKSSVLDGVCFALYGNVPRYDGPDKRLRSDYCAPDDPTEVRLEFTASGSRWLVVRSPDYERPKRRGDGMTPEPARAELFERIDDTWIGRAGKPRDVAEVLDGVLGLNMLQFQQVILLAQNKFSRFLLAKNDERQTLLRTLFGTRRYVDYATALADRAKAAQQSLRDRDVRAMGLLEEAERLIDDAELQGDAPPTADLASRRAAVDVADQRAQYRVEALAQERDRTAAAAQTAHAEYTRVTGILTAQRARDTALNTLEALEADAAAVAAHRDQLALADAALGLRAPLEHAARTERAQQKADAIEASARAAWADAEGEPPADLAALVEQLTGDIATWQAAMATESQLADATKRAEDAAAAIADLESSIVALDARGAGAPAQLSEFDARIDAALRDAAPLEGAEHSLDELVKRHAAAVQADQLAPRVLALDVARVAAMETSTAAAKALTAMLRRRLEGYAGELAATLTPGEPCAVCGATEHPSPAAAHDDPVTDALLAVAEHDRDAALSAEQDAAEAARAAKAEQAAYLAAAGGASVGALAEQVDAARGGVDRAKRATEEHAALVRERAELTEVEAQRVEERSSLAERLTAERERRASSEASAAGLRDAVAAARGEYSTISARLDVARARRDRARALAEAERTHAETRTAHNAALVYLDEAIAASRFDDAAAARAALRPGDEIDRIRAAVQQHERELAVVRAQLLELQLQLAGTPDEPVDTTVAEAALRDAETARDTAIRELSRAESTASGLRSLAERSDIAFAEIADLAADAAAIVRLSDTLQGRVPNTKRMALETFVLAAELEEIVAAANTRLAEMSSGRYTLAHSDSLAARGAASGLGIEVMDAHTGTLRPPQSLSGGETFLASLALALGLAEVVTSRAGGLRLDTLFIDEGFGSLDAETLEFAMRALDELRAGGRTVGVISHVEAMKDQLPAQLLIEASPQGPSIIRQG